MKTKNPKSLPKTASISPQWVKCGKANCRCSRGVLHGPYLYQFYRLKSRLHKRYIHQSNVAKVTADLAALREKRHQDRQTALSAWDSWRDAQTFLRQVNPNG
jgi:hypothetical protein